MARPSKLEEQRREFLPIVARAFAELGFRRATTAELAHRCGVQETILYRLWPDKTAVFVAAIGHVFDAAAATYDAIVTATARADEVAEELLDYEARHLGEHDQYRILFAGLAELDSPEIRQALAAGYRRFARLVRTHLSASRMCDRSGDLEPEVAAWAILGLGTISTITRELGLLGGQRRRELIARAGRTLVSNART